MQEGDFETTLVLARSARDGDRSAAQRLFTRYEPRIRELVSRRMGSALRKIVDVEDIVQESMLDAFAGIDRFRERSEARFIDWVAQIVENNIRDLHRSLTTQKRDLGRAAKIEELGPSSTSGSAVSASGPSPSENVRAAEIQEARARALEQLNPRYRRVIEMRDLEGKSYTEIAQDLGYRRPATVRVKYTVARQQLRQLMAEFDPRK